MATEIFDVLVIGGGPVGLATAYEVAKRGSKVIVLEQNNFFNHAGSSNDLARMFRTMYTENFMADLAKEAMKHWDALEKDAGTSLRWMSGLLNFGPKDYGGDTPEGTLMGPVVNLDRLGMSYKKLNTKDIEEQFPFKNLSSDYIGLYAPDNGVVNVQLLLRSLITLAMNYGAKTKQYCRVKSIRPSEQRQDIWQVDTIQNDKEYNFYYTKKIVVATGAYVNQVLKPSFGISLDLDIWEMVSSYFSSNAGPKGTIFPSMWFHFAPDRGERSQLFYGFPSLPWGPPNTVRISVDAATRRISDPSQRLTNVVNPDDIRNTQEFIQRHVVGVDHTVPSSLSSCLQTNVFDNMFVLDFIPQKFLPHKLKDSVVVFTAGWAMKFVPTIGQTLADMVLNGNSDYARDEFSITRKNPKTGRGIIIESKQNSRKYSKSHSHI